MKTIRIFISSPGDVSQERERASQVIQSLQRRYSRKFLLAPVFWENLPLEPDMSFQQGIDLFLKNPGVDVAVFILWSRLGSPLGASIRKADGSAYRSGTEREYDLMIQARAQSRAKEGVARPRMVIYTRRDDNSFDARLRGKSTAEKKEMLSQKELVESFMKETFKDAETGENIGAYHPFDRPVTFSQRLRAHLQSILDELAGDMDEVIWDVEKQGPPFLGLDAFQPEHADVFFGREEEILEARNALKEKAANGCAFLLLSGASGSGKSSLARAGILPEILDHEPNEEAEVWKSLIVTPAELGLDPILSLLNRLADPSLLPELIDQVPSFEDYAADLATNTDRFFQYSFPKAIEAATTRLGGSIRFVIVIDQLEELFTKDALSKESRSAFLALVETLARSSHFWIVATARSDFYQDLQSESAIVRMKEGRGLLDVLPPQPDAIARLIEEPARLAGITFEEHDGQKLSSRILRDAASHTELLPLLEFVLLELFNQADENQLTHAAYDELGGVEGALRRKAESTYNDLPGEAAEALGQILQALVTLGDESDTGGELDKPVRLRATLTTFPQNSPARQLIEAFIAARLFTTAQAGGFTEATFTVAHESLLRVWPRAVAWKNQNSDFLRARARIAARMKEGSPLLDGDPLLAMSKAFLVTRKDGFSASQTTWIEQAIAAAEVKTNQAIKRRRLAFTALSLLTLFSAAAAIWAMQSAKEAVRQKAEADAGFQAARSSTDDFLSRIAGEELSYIPGIQELREEMANKAITQYQALLSRKPDDLDLHLALGGACMARANILGQIGTLQEATAAFDGTIREVESLEKTHKSEAIRMLLAKCHIDYSRFRFNENLPDFKSHAETGMRLLRSLPIENANREVGKYGIIAHNLIGNGETDRAKKIESFEKGRAIALTLVGSKIQTDPVSIDILSGLAATTWNLGSQLLSSKVGSDADRYLQLRKEGEKLYADLKLAQPDSPIQQKNIAFTLEWQAKELLKEGKKEEAIKRYNECVSSWRVVAANNPNVTQFQRGFVLALKDYGIFMSQQGDFVAARASYEEAAFVSEKMIGKRADRPSNGIALLQVFNQLSEFEQFGKTNRDKGDPIAGARIREKAIELGRNLVTTYPASTEVSYELGKIMANHAQYEPIKQEPIRAAELYHEAIGLMDRQQILNPETLKSWHANSFLEWSSNLNSILTEELPPNDLGKLSNIKERIRILDQALKWMAYATSYNSKQQLMFIANRRLELYIESNQMEQALVLALGMIDFCESAYLEKPYHYYLRSSFAGLYESLASVYKKMGQPENELKARQRAIEIGRVPNCGRKVYEEVLSPTLTPTTENLERLRTVNEWGPKMKMFVIPCEVNGVKIPVKFYLHGGSLDKDFDPLADQARWLEEENGVVVPVDVRDSLRKLAKIAYENKVDFMNLCTYALNYPTGKPAAENQQADVAKNAVKKEPETTAVKVPGVAESKEAVDIAWESFEKGRMELAGRINALAFAALFDGKYAYAEASAREALTLASTASAKSSKKSTAELISIIQSNIAHAMLFQGKFQDAKAIYQRHWSDPMQGRLFKDGIVEDFDLFEQKKIVHSDFNKMKEILGITPTMQRIKGSPPPMEVPPWFNASMLRGETEWEITEKVRKVLEYEVIVRNYKRDVWTDDFVMRIAKAQYLAYEKAYFEERSQDSKNKDTAK